MPRSVQRRVDHVGVVVGWKVEAASNLAGRKGVGDGTHRELVSTVSTLGSRSRSRSRSRSLGHHGRLGRWRGRRIC